MSHRVFSREAYDSSDGMQTSIWGPLFWTVLHLTSFNYPVHPTTQQKEDYCVWLLSMGKVLPCRYCRENFPRNLRAAGFGPTVFRDRESFSRFVYELHNCVNRMLNKRVSLSYETIRDRYEGFRSRCLTQKQKNEIVGERGCVNEMYEGTKGKLCIQVVPVYARVDTGLVVDERCRPRRAQK